MEREEFTRMASGVVTWKSVSPRSVFQKMLSKGQEACQPSLHRRITTLDTEYLDPPIESD